MQSFACHKASYSFSSLMARIFIAIRFNDEFKKALVSIQDALKARGVSGNYCPYGNLHMTLVFIGERYDLQKIGKALSEVEFKPFTLTLDRLGSFPTKAGVIWCGTKENEPATTIANLLRKRLTAHGVSFSTKAFYPHISLVRHPSQIVTDIDVPAASIKIERVFVMKSERIDGELVYSEMTATE